MSLISLVSIAFGLLVLSFLVVLLTSRVMKSLRTVPVPPELEQDEIFLFSAETRAGIKLHQACYKNDPEAASDALTMWAWASGEPAVANNLDRKMEALRRPEFRLAVEELWVYVDSKQNKPWFGDRLWSAFINTHPEFEKIELTS